MKPRWFPLFWVGWLVGWLAANYFTGKHTGINAHLAMHRRAHGEPEQQPGFVFIRAEGGETNVPPPGPPMAQRSDLN